MNREEAKYLLSAYRMGGQDAGDPQFREALEMLRTDPELAHWFAREQALDRTISEKMASFPVPPDLKSRLLAMRKVSQLPRCWQRPSWVAAAAACFALALTIGVLAIQPRKPKFADFCAFVATIAAEKPGHLDLMSKDIVAVRQWLKDRNAPHDFVIPAGLNGLPTMGCRVLDWSGGKVSFVCFELENKHMIHLFVMDRGAMRKIPQTDSVQLVAMENGIGTLSWSDTQRVYVLTGHETGQELRKLL